MLTWQDSLYIIVYKFTAWSNAVHSDYYAQCSWLYYFVYSERESPTTWMKHTWILTPLKNKFAQHSHSILTVSFWWPHHILSEKCQLRAFQMLTHKHTQSHTHTHTYSDCLICVVLCAHFPPLCVSSQTSWWTCWESWPVTASQSKSWSCSSACWGETTASG